MSGQKPREIAAQVLQQHEVGRGDYLEDVLEKAFVGAALSPADRGLCQELTYGAVRWRATLDHLIARKTAGRTQKAGLQNILRLGLYQVFWLDRIPEHAAVHETVELARHGGFGHQAGFVNAVLRGYIREADATRALLADLKSTQPHLGYSHPEWLVARWQQRWGAEKAAALMSWNNTPPITCARVNTLKTEPGRLVAQWREEGVDYDFVRRDWFGENVAFELKSHPPLAGLQSFRQGLFYVQDPSTLLAVRELDPRPGERVLDLCAAPGGKTTFIAQLMKNEGRLGVHDKSAERLKLLDENCARLGVTCVERRPGAGAGRFAAGSFDRVLVDAPCSNTGVMRRRVGLRWRIRLEELRRLRQEQGELLREAATLVKPGGTVVYSTCSLEPEENQEVVDQFLRENPGFRLDHQRELLPFADHVDGSFVARLVRA